MAGESPEIFVIDFGGQTTHLIARRLKDIGIDAQIIDPDDVYKKALSKKPGGIILSGGPASVYEKNAPKLDKKVFSMGIPVLGICYGWQLMAHLLGGRVLPGNKEYGPTKLNVSKFDFIFYGLPPETRVIESHGDTVEKMPQGFEITASTDSVKYAGVQNLREKLFGLQFHPEAYHSEKGADMLKNFATKVCNLPLNPTSINTNQIIDEIRQKVGNKKVIGAISGGTDSSVAGALTAQAIGRNFIPFFVDSGLMREETIFRIRKVFPKVFGVKVEVIGARKLFLKKLKGISDPEEKRKAIGGLYIKLFEREMKKHKAAEFLLQGTTYADFIHSQGSRRSARIKSHHNVGGLPSNMKLKLLEPLRFYYTDQVREIGIKLGLPKDVIYQEPFPGPGHAVRIMGKVTEERLRKQIQADEIVTEEIRKAGFSGKVFQAFSIMTGTSSTAVKGDGRFYGEVVAVRIVNSKDRMSAEVARVPFQILERISQRIVNEVPNISRVVYDITSKPPATMEWE